MKSMQDELSRKSQELLTRLCSFSIVGTVAFFSITQVKDSL